MEWEAYTEQVGFHLARLTNEIMLAQGFNRAYIGLGKDGHVLEVTPAERRVLQT